MKNDMIPTDKTQKELGEYSDFYQSYSESYQAQNPDTVVSKLRIYRGPDGKIYTVSTWTDFMETLIPECDNIQLIILTFFGEDKELEQYSNSAFTIETSELLKKLGVAKPIKRQGNLVYLLPELKDAKTKNKILQAAKFTSKLGDV